VKEKARLLFQLALAMPLIGCGADSGAQTTDPAARLPVDCAPQTAPSAAFALDDFEDGDPLLNLQANLHGYWYVNNDGTGSQVPPLSEQGVTVALLADEGAPTSAKHSLYSRGSGFRAWGAFVATRLNSARSRACSFDVSASSALELQAKGTGTLRVNLGTSETTPIVDGGDCNATNCSDFGAVVALSPEWSRVVVAFDQLTQPDWAKPAAWDPSQLLRISIWSEQPDFELWIDDVGFY
jgi:hypothetical protein